MWVGVWTLRVLGLSVLFCGMILPAYADLKPTQIRQALQKLKKEFYANPDLSTLTKTSQELSKIKDATTWLAQHPNDEVTREFKDFHLSILEIIRANAMLSACAKGTSILKRKVNGMMSALARLNKHSMAGLASCDIKERKEALDDLDVYSALLEKAEILDDEKGKARENYVWKSLNDKQRAFQLDLAHQRSPQARSDFLGTKAVYYSNPKLAAEFAKSQEITTENQAKKTLVQSGYRPEIGPETEDYIQKKYGFELKENARGKIAAERARTLHLELMSGNRKNCFRNYIYFTQRFSFSDRENFKKSGDPYRALESKALSLFGKSKVYHGERQLPSYEEQELARLGQNELERLKKNYPGHETLNEDDVLKMLEPALKSIETSNLEMDRVNRIQTRSLDSDADKNVAAQQKTRAVSHIASKRVDKAFDAIKSSEVGFIVHSQVFQSNLGRFKTMSIDDKRKLVRQAVQENIEATEKYAEWISAKQGTKDFFNQTKGEWEYAQVAETLLYSSPSVIQGVVSKNPKLLGAMCLPLQEAARKRTDEVPDWVNWGGGVMMLVGGPAQPIAGTIFGVAATFASAADHLAKKSDLTTQKTFAGRGEEVQSQNWPETKSDQKELSRAIQRHDDALAQEVSMFAASEWVGRSAPLESVAEKISQKAKPLRDPSKFPGGSGGAITAGFTGRVVMTREIRPSDLPYRSTVRNPTGNFSSENTPLQGLMMKDKIKITDVAFASAEHSGSAGLVKLATLPNGRPVAVKSYHPVWMNSNANVDIKNPKAKLLKHIEAQANEAKRFADLGVGPRFHGVYRGENGTLYMVTDISTGDFVNSPNLKSFEELETILSRLSERGYDALGDFQYLIDADGALSVIDPSSAITKGAVVSRTHADYIEQRVRLLSRADESTQSQYLNKLEKADPEVWKAVMSRMRRGYQQ